MKYLSEKKSFSLHIMLMSKARQNGIRTLCFSSEIYGEEGLLSSSLDSLKGETQTLHFTETQCGSGS